LRLGIRRVDGCRDGISALRTPESSVSPDQSGFVNESFI
jgi:hypothetical protein